MGDNITNLEHKLRTANAIQYTGLAQRRPLRRHGGDSQRSQDVAWLISYEPASLAKYRASRSFAAWSGLDAFAFRLLTCSEAGHGM